MEELSNWVFWDNSLKDYLIVAGVILLVFILKKYLAHYSVGLVFFLLNKRYKQLDIGVFKRLVARPLGQFIAVLITIIALDRLRFPQALDFSIYRLQFRELVRMLGTALLIITFFRFLIKCVDFVVLLLRERYHLQDQTDNHQLFFFFKDFIKVVIGIIGGILLLKYVFRYDVKTLLTGLSIVGAAIALALKESLENLIASFIIFFDKPFSTGDYVKGTDFSGNVERIGLRSTRLRTDTKTYLTVPNKKMVDTVVDNQSNLTQRRTDLKLELEATIPSDKIRSLMEELRKILSRPEIQDRTLSFNDIQPGTLVISILYFTGPIPYADYLGIREELNLQILSYLEKEGLTLRGQKTHIQMEKQGEASSAGQ